jgi:hypothetical protein
MGERYGRKVMNLFGMKARGRRLDIKGLSPWHRAKRQIIGGSAVGNVPQFSFV